MMHRLLVGTALLLAGCQFTVPSTDKPHNNSTLTNTEHAPASEIWIALSHAIDAKTVTSTSQLAQLVVVLSRNGDLSSADVSTFDRAFPAVTTDRTLTTTDADKLRSLK